MSKRPGSPLEATKARKLTRYFIPDKNSSEGTAASIPDKGQGSVPSIERPQNVDPERKCDEGFGLQQLLSLEGLTTPQEIEDRFREIAKALFVRYSMRIRRKPKKDAAGEAEKEWIDTYLQIMEAEFYLIMPGVHEDPFCHGSTEQERSGIWYFHRTPKGTTNPTSFASVGGAYRSGSRKGLDLTIGSQLLASGSSSTSLVSHTRGGILLRSARNVDTKSIVSGPSLLVDFILKASGAETIESLVSHHWKGNLSAFESEPTDGLSALSFVPNVEVPVPSTVLASFKSSSTTKVPTIYRTPRIGLDLSHYSTRPTIEDPRVMFVQKAYRFVIEPHLLKANGRPQTFVGLLQHLTTNVEVEGVDTSNAIHPVVVSFPLPRKEEGRVIAAIERLGGFSTNTARSYLAHYQRGSVDKPALKPFCGSSGKGVCQSVEKLLTMFGLLGQMSQA